MKKLDCVFIQISLKLHLNLTDLTGDSLLLDKIREEARIYVLTCVLEEVKCVCVSADYYKSKNTRVDYKVDRLLYLIIIRVQKKVNGRLLLKPSNVSIPSQELKWLIKTIESEDGELFKLFLTRFFLSDKFVFDSLMLSCKEPKKLMGSILENVVIKITETLLYIVLLESELNSILKPTFHEDPLCLKAQKNNLYWESYIKSTFLKPRIIYTSIYVLKIITPIGVQKKPVYLPTLKAYEENESTTLQFSVLLYFELIDFLRPKYVNLFERCRLFLNKRLFKGEHRY